MILCNKTLFTAETIESLEKARLILVTATGYNNVDTGAASARGITVCNVPGYGTYSVAQHTIALLLELSNRIGLHDSDVHQDGWSSSGDWCYAKTPLYEWKDKTLGIIGMGRIGSVVADMANALGMQVLFYNRNHRQHAFAKPVSLDELFSQSDVISLHCPLTPENRELIRAENIKKCKRGVYIINTARGGLIQEQDLAQALQEGRIAGAALDVLSVEPPPEDHPLLHAPGCIITPHIAWKSREARQRIMKILQQNLEAFLRAEPVHVVN